jgi:hypothetical protein
MQQKHLALSRIGRCLQLVLYPIQLILAYRERCWVRHIEHVHSDKANGADCERIVGAFRHCLQKVCEALLVNIVIADDGALRHVEPVEFTTYYGIGGAASVIGYISR